jgi:hypothetical protein
MSNFSVKHLAQKELVLGTFTEGLDLSQDPMNISNEAMQKCLNFEYDYQTGRLKVVDGLFEIIDLQKDIDSLFYFDDEQVFICTSGTEIWKTDMNNFVRIGTLNGSEEPSYTEYNSKLLIASGGKIQEYQKMTRFTAWTANTVKTSGVYVRPATPNGFVYKCTTGGTTGSSAPTFPTTVGNTVTDGTVVWTCSYPVLEMSTSNNSEFIFSRASRVVTFKSGVDYIYYSEIADETSWTLNPNDESKAQELGVGVNDSMNITALVPLSQDMLVFKASEWNSKVWRVIGEPLDFTMVEVSTNAFCNNKFSAVQAANDVIFLGSDGLKSMSNVVEYGAVKQHDVGLKINKWLLSRTSKNTSKLWHCPSKRQIWIKSQNDTYIALYHYFNNCYSIRKFREPITGVIDNKGVIYLTKGTKLYKLDSTKATEDGYNIEYNLESKTMIASNEILIKKIVLYTEDLILGDATLIVGDISMPFKVTNGNSPLISQSTDLIFNNTSPIYLPVEVLKKEKRQINRKSNFSVKIIGTSGSFSLNNIRIGYAEVGK